MTQMIMTTSMFDKYLTPAGSRRGTRRQITFCAAVALLLFVLPNKMLTFAQIDSRLSIPLPPHH